MGGVDVGIELRREVGKGIGAIKEKEKMRSKSVTPIVHQTSEI